MENKNIEQKVGEAIGEASMCWFETPAGVFNSTKASKISENLMKDIKENVFVKDNLLETSFGLLCNVSGGDLTLQNKEWQEAFKAYRVEYFANLETIKKDK